jgi:hypothetical protein
MKRTTFTCAAVAAALLALPAQSLAQTPPATGSQPPAAAQPQTTDAAKKDAAREHLVKATAALETIKTDSLSPAAKKQVAELKRRINTLERSIAANDKAGATGMAQRSERATAGARGTANWGTEVAAIDKTLTAMLGPDAATPAPTGTTGAAKPSAGAALDSETRTKLIEVRTAITAFATAMAGGEPVKKDDETQPEPSAAPPASTPPSSDPQPTGAATPPQATPPSTQTPSTPAPAQPAGQPDEQEARRHLTDARNTLSALTQLPAASQLNGEARAQVSQLISNFNELISAQNNWKGSYDKVSANLALLIGSEGAQPAPPATGTPGAVGTSGTVAVDPTIREKLVELRAQLSEFEKAASGGTQAPTADPSAMATPPSSTPPSATPPSATPPSAVPSSSTPPSATPPSATPPSSTPPTAAPPAGTPETTPSAQTPAGAQPAAGDAEIVRHIAAIEALLKAEDDSGGLTLTKMQVEQLRTHWAALKAAIDRK